MTPQPARSGSKPRLKDLSFGAASADYEASHDPDLLLRGFIDPLRLAHEAIVGRKYLFLGYKGSGKSALGEHLLLLSKSDPHLFVRFTNIADVSLLHSARSAKVRLNLKRDIQWFGRGYCCYSCFIPSTATKAPTPSKTKA
jgi:hypothetical protein